MENDRSYTRNKVEPFAEKMALFEFYESVETRVAYRDAVCAVQSKRVVRHVAS